MTVRADDLAKAIGATKAANGWKARCPAHDDRTPSLSIREGDNGAALVTCHAGCERGAVIDALKARGHWKANGSAGNGSEEPKRPAGPGPIVPVPRDAPPCEWRHPRHGRPSATWEYHCDDGALHHVRARFDFRADDGAPAKEVLPLSFCTMPNGARAWAPKEPRGHMPLYGLVDVLERENSPVLIVEGEKAADAAAAKLPAYSVTTSAGGGKSSAKTDWRPLAGRRVVIWPDADAPGDAYALAVSKHCRDAGAASVAIVALPAGLPNGWDIADEAPDGVEIDAEALCNAARPDGDAIGGLTFYADCRANLLRGYVIKGVIGHGEMAMLTGESACGKSWTALDIGLRVACGMEWHGRRVRPGGVVFGASEAGLSARGRIEAWRKHHGVDDAPFAIYTDAINLLDASSVDRFLAAINAAKARFGSLSLVEIDTLSRAIPGGDENRPEGMTGAIGACDRIRAETGAALLLTHHLGKDGTRGPRGHSSLFAAVDVEMRIENQVITIAKARDTVAGAQFPFRLQVVELGHDIDGDPVTACVALPDETAAPETKGKSRGKPKGQAGLALAALKRATSEAGQLPPLDVPAEVRAVSVEMWRNFFYRDTPWDADTTQEAKKKAFQRARIDLIGGEHVTCRNDWCWPC